LVLAFLVLRVRGVVQFSNWSCSGALRIAPATAAAWFIIYGLCMLGSGLSRVVATSVPTNSLERTSVKFHRLLVRICIRLRLLLFGCRRLRLDFFCLLRLVSFVSRVSFGSLLRLQGLRS